MPNSVLKEALGLGRSVIEGVRIEGGSTIISARPRRRAPRCPVCGRRCDGWDRLATRRWRATDLSAPPMPPRVRAPARGAPRARRGGRGGALDALGGEQVRPGLRGRGRLCGEGAREGADGRLPRPACGGAEERHRGRRRRPADRGGTRGARRGAGPPPGAAAGAPGGAIGRRPTAPSWLGDPGSRCPRAPRTSRRDRSRRSPARAGAAAAGRPRSRGCRARRGESGRASRARPVSGSQTPAPGRRATRPGSRPGGATGPTTSTTPWPS